MIQVTDTPGGREIRIRERGSAVPPLILALLLGVYAGAALRLFPAYRNHPPDPLIFIAGIPMLLCFTLISTASNKKWLGGYRSIQVTPSTTTVVSRLLGITTSHREFANQAIQNLRYEEWFPQEGRWRLRQQGLRFEYEGTTQFILAKVTAGDCMDLIDSMVGVYRFSTAPSREPEMVTNILS